MNISKLKVFMKIVELNSLTKAAEELGYTQSGVSHMINSLEDELGFYLLTRSRSGVQLTKNGEKMVPIIREIMKWNEHLEQEIASIHGIQTGTIHIGTFMSVAIHWLPTIIRDFQEQFPKIKFSLVEGNYRQIENWLLEGKIDCGFLSLPSSDKLEVIELKVDPMMVILSNKHKLTNQPSITLDQLEKESLITLSKGADDDINRVFGNQVNNLTIKYTVGNDLAIMAMVEKELGISILPELVLRGQNYQIKKVMLAEPKYRLLGIGVRSMKQLSPAAKLFVGFVKNHPIILEEKAHS